MIYLYLLALAFFCGMHIGNKKSFAAIGYVGFNVLCGLLAYKLLFTYIVISVMFTMFFSILFSKAGQIHEDPDHDKSFKTDMILSTLLFWPPNVFDFFYYTLMARKAK